MRYGNTPHSATMNHADDELSGGPARAGPRTGHGVVVLSNGGVTPSAKSQSLKIFPFLSW